jgi:hypothetical protein
MYGTPVVIVGDGGSGREFLEVISAVNSVKQAWNFAGFVDDEEPWHDPDFSVRLI